MPVKKHSIIRSCLWNYAFLFMLIDLVDSLTVVIDSAFTKTLGPAALAAQGMSNPSFVLCNIFVSMLAVGICSKCSMAMSVGNSEQTCAYFSTGCFTAVVLACIVTFGSVVFLDPFVRLCGADGSDPVLQKALRDMLRGWYWGIPGYFGFIFFSQLVALDGNKRCVVVTSVVMLVSNAVMDLLAITVMKNGIWGIGFSTGISYIFGCLIMLTNFLRRRSAFRFSARAVKLSLLPGALRLGTPKLTQYGCKFLAPLIINNIIIAVGGSAAMAAFSMQRSLMTLCAVPGYGISHSVSLFTAAYYSDKDGQSLKEIADGALQLVLLTCVPISAIVLLFAVPIARFYLPTDPVACQYGVTALICMPMAILLNAVNLVILSYLHGSRKLLLDHLQTISHRLLWSVALNLLLSRSMGVNGLFLAVPMAELFVLLTYLCGAVLFSRRGSVMETILLLPESFHVLRETQFRFTVTNLEEAVNISDSIDSFCREQGIDSRRSMFAALCVEELVTNVVKHGFRKDIWHHSCDVCVRVEDGDVVLRFRDDCRYFNLKERYEAIRTREEDISANVGIRLVYQIAKDIRYVNLLDTNTLIIRV